MRLINTIPYLLLFLTLAIMSCEREEGLGGNSSITGTVYEIRMDRHGDAIDTFADVSKSIYIRYGESQTYQDKVSSYGDGYFEFGYLRPGDYSIYAYSECVLCPGGDEEIALNLSLNKSEDKENVDLYLINQVDYDDGDCTVGGKLMYQEYLGPFPTGDVLPSQENEVYIVYGEDSVYFDRMDTGANGNFEFQDLIPGTYTLYAYSECASCTDTLTTVSSIVTVGGDDLFVSGGEMVIEKR